MDKTEQTSNIVWDHYGKIDEVQRDPGSGKARLWFDYDAMGNRIKKTVWAEGSSDPEDKSSQFYLRDPQGNVIAIYHLGRLSGNEVLKLREQHIYGSARLGLQERDLTLYNLPSGSGSGGGMRLALDSLGQKAVVISEIFPKENLLILGNLSALRVNLAGLQLADSANAQFFEIPNGISLDSGQRLIIAFGDVSQQPALAGQFGWATDT
ncbi:MAG: hypothetical protein KAG66_07345, partial [Methylococcales bacterium]|nr:hypothetical protein [Methylococcales bacterium]